MSQSKKPIVIIVEPRLEMQEMLLELLRDVAQVVPAFSVLAGWNAFRQADKSRLALIMVSSSAPSGRGGPSGPVDVEDLIRLIRRTGGQDIDIAAISGHPDKQKPLLAAGANIDLPKPFNTQAVLNIVENWVMMNGSEVSKLHRQMTQSN